MRMCRMGGLSEFVRRVERPEFERTSSSSEFGCVEEKPEKGGRLALLRHAKDSSPSRAIGLNVSPAELEGDTRIYQAHEGHRIHLWLLAIPSLST